MKTVEMKICHVCASSVDTLLMRARGHLVPICQPDMLARFSTNDRRIFLTPVGECSPSSEWIVDRLQDERRVSLWRIGYRIRWNNIGVGWMFLGMQLQCKG